ncbi:hypothetical protein GW17_00019887 [Ensete ventricosum]|nr:hypothetical protein GW17_00019887 [Ensete ventricosum]
MPRSVIGVGILFLDRSNDLDSPFFRMLVGCPIATYGYAVRGGGKLPAIGGLAEREVIDWQGLSHHLVIEAMDHEVISTLLQVDWNHHCPP